MLDRAEIVAACFRQVFMEGGQSCPQPPFRRPAAFAGDSGGAGKLTNYQKLAGDPQLWARAPGRVDLMGSHTDYNLGFVLTLPIGRDTWIAARRRDDGIVRVHSMNLDASDEFRLDAIEPVSESRWRNYVRGVAAILQNEGLALTGCDAIIHSTVPVAAGLSSSAALECALATLFSGLGGWSLTGERKALLCQKAENEFVGVKCGILDQYSSCLGRRGCALLLDCRDLSTRAVRIADGIRVVVCNTMSPRRLSGGEYAQRRAECEQGAAALGGERFARCDPGDAGGQTARTSGADRAAVRVHRRRKCAGRVAGRGARSGQPAGRGPSLHGVVCRRAGSLRDLLPGDGGYDGSHARRARSDRREAGGCGIRRLHGRPGGRRIGGRLPRRRPERLSERDPGVSRDLPGGCRARG
jgi:hypothetical protein